MTLVWVLGGVFAGLFFGFAMAVVLTILMGPGNVLPSVVGLPLSFIAAIYGASKGAEIAQRRRRR